MIFDSSINICEQEKHSSRREKSEELEELNLFCNQETEFGRAPLLTMSGCVDS